MSKKTYSKPQLKSRKIELGVFGDYTRDDTGDGRTLPAPLEIIRRMEIRME